MLDRLASKYVGKNKPTEKLVLCVENNSGVCKNNIDYKKRNTDEKEVIKFVIQPFGDDQRTETNVYGVLYGSS